MVDGLGNEAIGKVAGRAFCSPSSLDYRLDSFSSCSVAVIQLTIGESVVFSSVACLVSGREEDVSESGNP